MSGGVNGIHAGKILGYFISQIYLGFAGAENDEELYYSLALILRVLTSPPLIIFGKDLDIIADLSLNVPNNLAVNSLKLPSDFPRNLTGIKDERTVNKRVNRFCDPKFNTDRILSYPYSTFDSLLQSSRTLHAIDDGKRIFLGFP
ncbi:hypothetical protein [Ensifer sp. SL37]|uniref:hypothetical protein n=1 Tax=Ensifer sp. SL37 TaxID=2995137 RepID=UPI0022732149|nr:hypothetical protein [Ensifer sp. SL37]MCY1744284.1 hypothetical protein [Ensifer sp. SL37]